MPVAVRLREDFSADELRGLARRSKDVSQSRRLLALAAVRDGKDRAEAARIGGMDRQTLRDWVHRYNAEGLAGLQRIQQVPTVEPRAAHRVHQAERQRAEEHRVDPPQQVLRHVGLRAVGEPEAAPPQARPVRADPQ